MEFTKDDLERFASKFTRGAENECWEWKAGKFDVGYGAFFVKAIRQNHSASRVAWMIHSGQNVPKGMVICHTCDNRACVNPAHLYLGDHRDNNTDTIKRGRGNRTVGENCSWAKLTESDVLEIRSSRERQFVLAKRFGLHPSTVSQIKAGLRWKHI